MPESPPEQVSTARPAAPRRPRPRLGEDASQLEQLVRDRGPRPRRPPRPGPGRPAGRPATAPVCAAAASAPAAEAPTLSTATPTPRSAQRASDSASRAPSPSSSRNRATERTPSPRRERPRASRGVEHRLVAGRDERVEVDPAPGADRVDGEVPALGDHRHGARARSSGTESPQSGARAATEMTPLPLGPQSGSPPARATSRSSRSSSRPVWRLAEARGEDDRAAAAALGRLGEGRRDLGRGDREDHRVDRLREVRRRRARNRGRAPCSGSGGRPRPARRSRPARGCAGRCRRRSPAGRSRRPPPPSAAPAAGPDRAGAGSPSGTSGGCARLPAARGPWR